MRDRAVKRNQSCRSCARRRPIDPDRTHKICGRCKQLKEVSEFSRIGGNRSDGLQAYCRECSNALARENYQENKEYYYRLAVERNKELRRRLRELKQVPCADCGQEFDPVCMDFDHLPQFKKSMAISYMLRHRMSWDKILAEIAKCEVVCSNCHRLRTKLRGEEAA